MRNLVKNHDLPDNLPRIKDLEVGSLFRFEDGREYNNVYIKTDQGILFLATGAHYTTHNEERQVHAVKSVTITRA